MGDNGKDPIDQAISPSVAMRQFQVTIASTGRPAILALPSDATDGELAELAGWLLTSVLGSYRQERTKGAASRLIVPTVALPRN